MNYRKPLFFLVLIYLAIPLIAADFTRPEMISVRGGTFFMGSNENRIAERPFEVTVRSFLISRTPITQGLYTAVMNENPSFFKNTDNPVEMVDWYDAVRFCNALSTRIGLPPAYRIDGDNITWIRESRGFRLPTEAEWEFAARGGIFGSRGPLDRAFFAGGEGIDNPSALDYSWFSLNARNPVGTRPVGGKLPNQLGIFDMSGNVWEWCWDWFAEYPSDTVSDYFGPVMGRNRVYRGGSYMNNMNLIRTTSRDSAVPTLKARTVGFRIVQNG